MISPWVRCPGCKKIHIVLPALTKIIKCPKCFTDLHAELLRMTR
jgi:ribosomal protein S27E